MQRPTTRFLATPALCRSVARAVSAAVFLVLVALAAPPGYAKSGPTKGLSSGPLTWAIGWLESWVTKEPVSQPRPDVEPLPTFDDIGGYHEAKAALEDIIRALNEPERLRRLGVRAPRGVLLVGPPGTGKTLFARALATEAKVNFVRADGPGFNDMFVGAGQVRLRALFARARALAPVIIFIDEIDAIGAKRSSMEQARNDNHLLDQLLVELDGFRENAGIVVVGATNRADVLDPALTRSGRFDRRIFIGLPDREARQKILALKLAEVTLAEDVDIDALVELTAGLSGADIANWVSIAAMHALREERDYICQNDFERGSNDLIFGVNEKIKSSEEALWQTCVHEAGHALVGTLSAAPRRCTRIVVDPRGGVAGFTQWAPDEVSDTSNRAYLRANLAMALGGLAAESVLLGEFGSGGSSDLLTATKLAESAVLAEGMGERAGLISLVDGERGDWRDEGNDSAYADIRGMLARAQKDAEDILISHRSLLEQVAQRLKVDGKLSGAELRKMIDDHHRVE